MEGDLQKDAWRLLPRIEAAVAFSPWTRAEARDASCQQRCGMGRAGIAEPNSPVGDWDADMLRERGWVVVE
jgi:hypothetical protein